MKTRIYAAPAVKGLRVNSYNDEFVCTNQDSKSAFYLKSCSALFEYLPYGFTTIGNNLISQRGDRL